MSEYLFSGNDRSSRPTRCSRRHFIGYGSGMAVAASLAATGFEQAVAETLTSTGPSTASGRYRVGLIGAGWYGKSDLFRLIQVAPVDVVAISDPDRKMLAEAAQLASQRQLSKQVPQTYGDHRKMLAEHEFDIILIGSPDHWHALQMIDAVEAGADVYVQKP